jgi:hypothetical protein
VQLLPLRCAVRLCMFMLAVYAALCQRCKFVAVCSSRHGSVLRVCFLLVYFHVGGVCRVSQVWCLAVLPCPLYCKGHKVMNRFEPATQKWRRVCACYIMHLAWAAWLTVSCHRFMLVDATRTCLGGVCQCARLVWLGASVEGSIMLIAWGVCLGSSVAVTPLPVPCICRACVHALH